MAKILDIFKMVGSVSWSQSGIEWTREKGLWRWAGLWRLLINIGCRFESNTLIDMVKWCNKSSYNLQISMPGESHYALAAQMGHTSFCGAYEELRGRRPFITKGIGYCSWASGYNCHNASRTQGRLVIGSKFTWQDESVEVTSFKDAEKALIACAYHKRKDGYKGKVKRRFKITVPMLKAEERWLTATKEFPIGDAYCKAAKKMGIKSYQELATVDIRKKLKGKRVTKATIESLIESQAKLKAALPDHRKRGI